MSARIWAHTWVRAVPEPIGLPRANQPIRGETTAVMQQGSCHWLSFLSHGRLQEKDQASRGKAHQNCLRTRKRQEVRNVDEEAGRV